MISPVVQWLRIHLAMQGMCGQSHIRGPEISPTMEQLSLRHNCWACTPQPESLCPATERSRITQLRPYISEVAQSCPTLCDPTDCSLPGSSVHGISQTIVLEWIAISFSRRGSSQPRDRTSSSRIVDRRFTIWATREVLCSLTKTLRSQINK